MKVESYHISVFQGSYPCGVNSIFRERVFGMKAILDTDLETLKIQVGVTRLIKEFYTLFNQSMISLEGLLIFYLFLMMKV